MRRMYVNKSSSARNFRRNTENTKRINLAPRPMRGGFRL